MIKLIVDPIVLKTLKQAMPKTKKAEDALEKYINKLQLHIDKSLMSDLGGLYRKTSLLYLSTHSLALDVGQFTIDGKKQYLHQWLEAHKVNLIYVKEVGEKNKNSSLIGLTNLVTINDAMDLQTLKKKSINELDQLLKDITLDDEDLYLRLFPDFVNPNKQYILANYDFCPINIKSLEQFIYWASLRANKITDANRHLMLRQAEIILRVAKGGDGEFPMKKNPSPFGRTYYEGVSVVSVKKELRMAMLGTSWEYDAKSCSIAWKMSFASQWHAQKKRRKLDVRHSFPVTTLYLEDKEAFFTYVIQKVFEIPSSQDYKPIIKEAMNAIGFGAKLSMGTWHTDEGWEKRSSLFEVFDNDTQALKRFIECDLVLLINKEQQTLNKFIVAKFSGDAVWQAEMTAEQQRKKVKQFSAAQKIVWLYQHAETIMMDMVRAEVKKSGNTVLANVHDAVVVRNQIPALLLAKIEGKVQQRTGVDYFRLGETGY